MTPLIVSTGALAARQQFAAWRSWTKWDATLCGDPFGVSGSDEPQAGMTGMVHDALQYSHELDMQP
jgi:hypothetical protein